MYTTDLLQKSELNCTHNTSHFCWNMELREQPSKFTSHQCFCRDYRGKCEALNIKSYQPRQKNCRASAEANLPRQKMLKFEGCQYLIIVARKGLRKVNKPILIHPVRVVKFALTFLSLLCWGTPSHNCSIVCIVISATVNQIKGSYCYWVWDPTQSGIIYSQGSLKYKDK